MKVLLTALILFAVGSVHAQDTIRHYIDPRGNTTDFSKAAYFRTDTPSGTYRGIDFSLFEKISYLPADLGERNGRFIFLDTNEVKMADVTFVQDKIQGVALFFFPDGSVSDSCLYKDGLLSGTSTYFYPDGTVAAVERYQAQLLQSFELFHPDGMPDKLTSRPTYGAEFPGGLPALYQFLADSMKYPDAAVELSLEGKCFLQFVLDTTGTVSKVTVLRGVPDCPQCDLEAIRVVRSMPQWTPGKAHNRYVESTFNLPIVFALTTAKEKRKDKKRKGR